MNGSAGSAWPTAKASAQWATPQAHDVRARGKGQTSGESRNGAGNRCLATDAEGLYNRKGASPTSGDGLATAAGAWPTPAGRDCKGGNSASYADRGGGTKGEQLPNFVAHRFSHPLPTTLRHGLTLSALLRIWRPLRASVIASHGQATWRRLAKSRKRRLNPLFVEWRMGWPPGHALCDCSAMEWSHWSLRMRGALSALPTASGPWIWKPPAETAEARQMTLFGEDGE